MKNLDGKKIEIKELLSREYFYRVPEYQRPYSWDKDNFEDLIQDLFDAEKGQEYFLGTAVLHKKVDGVNDIVDGQQRLTTLMILYACLRDMVTDSAFQNNIQEKIIQEENVVDGIPQKVRVEVKDREIFNELIVAKGGTLIEKEEEHLSESELRYVLAINIFKDKLKLLSQDALKKFIQFLSQNCIMIFLSTTTFDDAFRLFTIVNDRGKQLRRIDVLKAQNIAPDIIKSEALRNSLSKKWEECEKSLGEDTFEEVFYLLRFLTLGEKPYADLLSEFEEKIFKKGLLQKGEAFVDTICAYANLYNDVFEDFTYFDTKENRNRIISLLFIMNKEFKSNDWKACVLLYLKKFKTKNFEKFLSLLELKYLEAWLLGLNKDARTIIFGNIVKAINSVKKSDDVISSSFLKTDNAAMKEIIEANIYGKAYCKYMLLRLELLTTEHDVEKKIQAKSIEHVLPQTISDSSDWKKWFTDDEKNNWQNKIANLVLLSKSKNSAASNYDFGEKKDKYLENRVSDYPRSIEVLKYDSWTPRILIKRQLDTIKIAFNDIL